MQTQVTPGVIIAAVVVVLVVVGLVAWKIFSPPSASAGASQSIQRQVQSDQMRGMMQRVPQGGMPAGGR